MAATHRLDGSTPVTTTKEKNMSQRHLESRSKVSSAVVLGAVAAGALAAAGLGPAAPSAQASCVSAFGLSSNPAQCSSTIASVAIAIGTGTQAHADGLLGAAFAFGTGSIAATGAGGIANLSATFGANSYSIAAGYVSTAIAGGSGTVATAGVPSQQLPINIGNMAVSLFNTQQTVVTATGVGNLADNLLGGGNVVAAGFFNSACNMGGTTGAGAVVAAGILNTAMNMLGQNVTVVAGGGGGGTPIANVALNVLGSANTVIASPGPLALAASVGRSQQVVTKIKPGININGFRLPNTAASVPASAATRQAGRHPAAASAATSGRD